MLWWCEVALADEVLVGINDVGIAIYHSIFGFKHRWLHVLDGGWLVEFITGIEEADVCSLSHV